MQLAMALSAGLLVAGAAVSAAGLRDRPTADRVQAAEATSGGD
jgi:hypothetical protein